MGNCVNPNPSIPLPLLPTGDDTSKFFPSPSTKFRSLYFDDKYSNDWMKYDFIVIGSGPCGYAFTERILKAPGESTSSILMVEGGDLFLPDHFQNLPYQFKQLVEHDFLETSPWLPPNNRKDQNQMFLHGMVPYFGGKSILWSGWCPSPKAHQLTNWPEVIRNILLDHENIEAGKRLLQV